MYEGHGQHGAVRVRSFFSSTFSLNFVLETMQLLKYYKTLSMHNKFADIFFLHFQLKSSSQQLWPEKESVGFYLKMMQYKGNMILCN